MHLVIITRFLGSRMRALFLLDLRMRTSITRLPCTHFIEASGLLLDSLFGYVPSCLFPAMCCLVHLCLRAVLFTLYGYAPS